MKSTKRALFLSVISIILCASMLVGTTYAWFTDTVISGGNLIKSGTLDVGMYWANGTKDIPENDSGWIDASESPIFNYNNWEPGYTDVRHIKIRNEGSLAFKYQVNIIAHGEVTALANVIDVYYIDPAVKIENRKNLSEQYRLGTLAEVLEGVSRTASGILYAGKEENVTIALKMRETAGNEYQGMSIGSDFTVQLLATQFTYEKDSFDHTYDKDAFSYNLIVRSNDELSSAIALDGDLIIAVDGDLTYDFGSGAEAISKLLAIKGKTIIGWDKNDSVTFKGDSAQTVEGVTLTGITVKNGTEGDGYLKFADLKATDVKLEGGTSLDGFCTLTECRAKSVNPGEYALKIEGGSTVIADCFISGTRAIMINEEDGANVKKVTVDNCIFGGVSEATGVVIGNVDPDTSVIIKDSYFVTTKKSDEGLYTYDSATDVSTYTLVCGDDNTIIPDAIIVESGDEYRAATRGKNVVIFEDIVYDNDDPTKQLNPRLDNDINFYGFNSTVTLSGADPDVGNHGYFSFIPPKGMNVNVQDLTVTGVGYVGLGDYKVGVGGTHVVTNLNIKDMVSPLDNWNGSDRIGLVFSTYGKNTTLNNCVMTGATSMFEGVIPYDAGFPNSTTSTINGGQYGAVRLWETGKLTVEGDAKIEKLDSRACMTKAGRVYGKLTLKAGTHVKTLRLIPDGSFVPSLVIEEGAKVDTIIYLGVSYTQAEWLAR